MASDDAKLFVAGLPDSVSEDVLRQLFEATGGQVVSVSIPKDRTTGRPRGFGFVTMNSPEEAKLAREALDGSLQAGRSISVRPFQADPPRGDAPRESGFRSEGGGFRGAPRGEGPGRGGPPPQDRTLYVGNLPYDASQEEITSLVNSVSDNGVVRVNLPMDPDGRKRGFGFVTLSSSDGAKTAADALASAELRGRRLIVNIAHPKGDRPAREGGDFGGGGGGRDFGGGPPRDFGGGPPRDFGGGPPRDFGGGPPRDFGGPPRAPAKNDRRRGGGAPGGSDDGFRKPRGGAGGGGGRGGGGGGGRGRDYDDWDDE